MKDKYIKIICPECKGVGLIKTQCFKCVCITGCMLCENKNKTPYKECEKCIGLGFIQKYSQQK